MQRGYVMSNKEEREGKENRWRIDGEGLEETSRSRTKGGKGLKEEGT